MIPITLGTVNFNAAADADGTLWYVTKIEGWEGPEMRTTSLNVTGYAGVAIGENQYAERPIILTGIVKATSEANFWTAYNTMLGLVSGLYSETVLTLTENGVGKQLGVLRSGPPRVEIIGVGSFGFELPLVAMYPIKLNSTESSLAYTSPITVTNSGNYMTWPVIVMTAAGAPYFTSGTSTVGFTASLPINTTINFRNKTIISPTNVDEYSKLDATADDWWALMPGANTLTKTGGGTATIYWRHAYL